jgi:hypothetical protein
MKKLTQKYKVLVISGILVLTCASIFLYSKSYSKVKFVANCSDSFVIPKQNKPPRDSAVEGHFDTFTADEQFFVDSKLMELYPTEDRAINKFLSSIQCGDKLFPKLVSISPDFATGKQMLIDELIRQENTFRDVDIYNLKKINTKCGDYYRFEARGKKYFTKVNLDRKQNFQNFTYQKLTITFPVEQSISNDNCIDILSLTV